MAQIEPRRHAGDRALWAAVVMQATNDIAVEPLCSVQYADAAAFFTGSGAWSGSRAVVADHLNLHPDDLERCGRQSIARRYAIEGLPPPAVAPERRPATTALATKPRMAKPLVARQSPLVPAIWPLLAAPVDKPLLAAEGVRGSGRVRGVKRRSGSFNPFFPNRVMAEF